MRKSYNIYLISLGYDYHMPRKKFPDKDFTWTTDLAYAVGLLVTDGNLSKSGRSISMRSAEPVMLETFKRCLNIDNEAPRGKPTGYL